MVRKATVRIVALALATGLLSFIALPVSADAPCRQITRVTTLTSGGLTLTPLDAIAFPVPPVPTSFSIVRQVVICPSVAAPMFPVVSAPVFPAISPFPVVIGTPVFVVDPPATAPSSALTPSSSAPQSSAPAVAATVPVDTVRDLAERSAQYDRMVVTVTGTVAGVAQRADARGIPLTEFRLDAEGASIGVLVWGHSAPRAGERVRVTGPFYVSTPFVGSSGTPWRHVIEAEVLDVE